MDRAMAIILFDDHANVLQMFWHFMRLRKKFWLMPALITMMALGGLMLLDQVPPDARMLP